MTEGTNLQVLVVPMLSKQELNADSNYVVITALVRALLRRDPTMNFVILWPDGKSGYTYEDDGFFADTRIARAFTRIPPRKLANAMHFDAGWWDIFVRHCGFDVAWVNLVEVAANVWNAGQGSYSGDARPTVIAAHNYVIHETLPYPISALRSLQLAQLVGALTAQRNVFNSEHCEKMFYDNAREFLSPAALESIRANSIRIPYGTLEPALRLVDTQNEVPVIAYNHRLLSYKNFTETFEVLDELWKSGVRFRVRYMNNTSENASKVAHYPFVEVVLCATRADYLAALRGCDLNVSNSFHETFCIAAAESMALGQPLVAPNGITFPEITGARENGYPYLFDTRAEQLAALRTLLTQPEERKRWGAILSAHVRREYGSDLWAERYHALFDEKKFTYETTPQDTLDMVSSVLRANSGASVREAMNRIYQSTAGDRTPLSNQSLSASRFVRMARHLGAEFYLENGAQHVRMART